MLPLIITIPLALLLLLFCTVMGAAGLGLIIGATGYFVSAVSRLDWRGALGVLGFGVPMALFGWIVLAGSWTTGADIIDGFITRFLV